MFTLEQLTRYADVLLWGLDTARSKPYQRGDIVVVRFDLEALPLAETLQQRLVGMGLNPIVRLNLTPTMEKAFYGLAGDDQLSFVAPGEDLLSDNLHGIISLLAPASLTHLRDVDPGRIGVAARARKRLRDILDRREEVGDFGWTLCAWPTEAQAQCAGLTLDEYTAQIVQACRLEESDPVAAWGEIFETANEVKQMLNSLPIETLHVESDSCDLRLAPGDMRRWIGVSGHNIPSFEIFLSPDWRTVDGVYHADQPSYRNGNYVRGVTLEFAKGRVVKATAQDGQDFLRKQVEMDEGAAQVGEFSLTDKRFSRIDRFMANTLFDENFGGPNGNCHLALGASYSDTYAGDPAELDADARRRLGFNDSALHWDLVNTEEKRVTAKLAGGGSRVVYDKGCFID
ncbi:MAG: aminopeptidase [Desulfovibrionales bacterium]|jgi:aminopeptidase|nr:aminopeptidase [Desulfovibrionales bacterium]